MAKLNAARVAQYPLVAEFTFNFNDTIKGTDGVERAFNAAALVADIVELPMGAVVIGGELVVEVSDSVSTTWTLSLGDAASATRYANAVSLKSAARTPLTLSGSRLSEKIRATLAATGTAPTGGKVTVRVLYVITGRANEVN
jgi:hypothetical protein